MSAAGSWRVEEGCVWVTMKCYSSFLDVQIKLKISLHMIR
jgi:hypothetical protein